MPDAASLAALLGAHPGTLVLTGAGISTDSGIPDYRGPDGTRRVTPMQHGEFVGTSEARQRYWARSFIGWQRVQLAPSRTPPTWPSPTCSAAGCSAR